MVKKLVEDNDVLKEKMKKMETDTSDLGKLKEMLKMNPENEEQYFRDVKKTKDISDQCDIFYN